MRYGDKVFDIFLGAEQLSARVREMAAELDREYKGRTVQVICVLNGAMFFCADIVREMQTECVLSFMRLKSYEGIESTGRVEELVSPDVDIRDKDVLVVEDIVESGLSMHYLKGRLSAMGPRSLKVVSLLFKPSELRYEDARPDMVGFEIGSEFVIGYGLDIDGKARDLKDIYRLKI